MDSNEPGVTPKFYNLTDAARVIGVKPELVLRALPLLPALRQRSNQWTIEDLAQIDDIIKTQIVWAERGRR